jgi:hypothetical protein
MTQSLHHSPAREDATKGFVISVKSFQKKERLGALTYLLLTCRLLKISRRNAEAVYRRVTLHGKFAVNTITHKLPYKDVDKESAPQCSTRHVMNLTDEVSNCAINSRVVLYMSIPDGDLNPRSRNLNLRTSKALELIL